MKSATRLLLVLSVFCLAAVAGYLMVRPWHTPAPNVSHGEDSELQWLENEYRLSHDEVQRIRKIHAAYRPHCMEMCRAIAEANSRVANLLQNSTGMTPEIATALKEAESTNARCRAAMLDHIFQVAAQMPPEQGQRYIREVAPRLLAGAHPVDEVMNPSAGAPR